jgi:hypothetical protein
MQNSAFWQNRVFWMLASLAVGVLQAWDSGVLWAGAGAQTLTAIGLLAPIVAIGVTEDFRIRIVALASGALLLVWARAIAAVPLNTLHLALFVPALYILFVSGMARTLARGAPR